MVNQESATYNPRAGNGSAYDLMNSYAALQQAGIPNQAFYQTPTSQQNWQHQFSQQPWQQQQFSPQPFANQQYQSQPYSNQQFSQQQPFNFNVGGQQQQFNTPWQNQSSYGQSPYAGQNIYQHQQSHVPAITHRAAELKLKIPVNRIIGKHPIEVQHYLQQVVVPILLDALVKRAISPELGLSITTDLRGELVAEIDI